VTIADEEQAHGNAYVRRSDAPVDSPLALPVELVNYLPPMSEPERPAVEPTTIDQALAPDWWETHRNKIFIAFGIAVIAILAWGGVAWMQQKRVLEAREALAEADTPGQLQSVAANYEGMPEAASALLFLAEKQVDDGQVDAAFTAYTQFLETYPDHPMAATAKTAQGMILEKQGKNAEALALYQQVTTLYPAAYVTPFAMLSQARLDRAMGRFEESENLLETIVTQYPASGFATEAQTMLEMTGQ
jgi:TolA-binding protein